MQALARAFQVHPLAVPTHLKRHMRAYLIGDEVWILAHHQYQASSWLVLKREGFTAHWLFDSVELFTLTIRLGEEALGDIYSMYHDERPSHWFTLGLREDVEELILSGRLKVFKLSADEIDRIANPFDPLMGGRNALFATEGDQLIALRNNLAEELAAIIITRWGGKDQIDRVHWDRHFFARELVEAYDTGLAVADVVVSSIKGLLEIGQLLVTVAGDIIKVELRLAVKTFTGDVEGLKDELRAAGVYLDDKVKTAQDLVAQAKQGLAILNLLFEDPLTRVLMKDFLSALYQTINYRESRTLPVTIVTVIGIEVVLALFTAGAGNAARWGGRAAVNAGKAAANNIGPFTRRAIDLLADLASQVRQRANRADVVEETRALPPPEVQRPKEKVGDREETQDGDFVPNTGGPKVDMHHVQGEVNPNKWIPKLKMKMPSGTGGHYLNPNIRVINEIRPRNSLGVYEAQIEVFDSANNVWVPKLNPKGKLGKSTMFPDHWDEPKIIQQIQEAYIDAGTPTSGKWTGQSSSGLKVQGYVDESSKPFDVRTAWPVYEDI